MGMTPAVHGEPQGTQNTNYQINSGIDMLPHAYPNLFLLGSEVV